MPKARRQHPGRINGNTKFYEKDGLRYCVRDIQDLTGLSHSVARRRLEKWVKGEMSLEALLAQPSEWHRKIGKKGNCTSSMLQRKELLDSIPGPTEYERQHPELLA